MVTGASAPSQTLWAEMQRPHLLGLEAKSLSIVSVSL